jgi:hypothetical protein
MRFQTSEGGFQFPRIYQKNQTQVEDDLAADDIDYADLTQWTFPDEFLCYVHEIGLLKFIDKTYPNPREKNEVPIWFLVSCQFVMRFYQTGRYNNLRYLLNAGSLLTRFGYNVGTTQIGFNSKNKNPRKTVIHDDTVRKFFKDTDHQAICSWYRTELQQWFKSKRVFHPAGLFILDQSHLVVPDNANYRDAVKMPVDEHGQLYKHLSTLSDAEKKALVYHRSYALSALLHTDPLGERYHIAGYELGAGNIGELAQAENIVSEFCRATPGVMKELIVDRGYIDGDFFSQIKKEHNVDLLIPLKTNMASYREALALSQSYGRWNQ